MKRILTNKTFQHFNWLFFPVVRAKSGEKAYRGLVFSMARKPSTLILMGRKSSGFLFLSTMALGTLEQSRILIFGVLSVCLVDWLVVAVVVGSLFCLFCFVDLFGCF